MKLDQMKVELDKLKFPFYQVIRKNGLTDCVYIVLSLDKKGDWPQDYIENSRYAKLFIFLNNERYELDKENKYTFEIACNRTGKKIMQAKNRTGEQIINHVVKQLSKIIN